MMNETLIKVEIELPATVTLQQLVDAFSIVGVTQLKLSTAPPQPQQQSIRLTGKAA